MGEAGKGDDGDGNGEDERERRKKKPDSKVSVSDEEGEEGEEEDEEDQAGKIINTQKHNNNLSFSVKLQSNPGISREREKLPRQAKNMGQQRGGARPKNFPLNRSQRMLEASRQKNKDKLLATEQKRKEEKDKAHKKMIAGGRNTFVNMYSKDDNLETASIASSMKTQVTDTGLSIQSGVSSIGPTPHGFDKTREYEKESDSSQSLPQLRSLLKPVAGIGQDVKVMNPSTIHLLYSNFNIYSSRLINLSSKLMARRKPSP